MDELVLGGHRFTSRLVVGTGKYNDFSTMKAALEASGAQMVTVAVRRLDLQAKGDASLLHWIPKGMVLLPNTAGCFTADDAVRTCRLARELQLGGENPLVKLEVLADQKTLLPDAEETVKAARQLVSEGFRVLPYTNDDPVTARKLEDAGCAAGRRQHLFQRARALAVHGHDERREQARSERDPADGRAFERAAEVGAPRREEEERAQRQRRNLLRPALLDEAHPVGREMKVE